MAQLTTSPVRHVHCIAARVEHIVEDAQAVSLFRPDHQAFQLMLVVLARPQGHCLVKGDLHIHTAQLFRRCAVITALEFEQTVTLVRSKALKIKREVLCTEVDTGQEAKTLREVCLDADFQLAP